MLTKQFIKTAPEPIKAYAENRVNGLEWEDDQKFRQAMEDIMVVYDAYAMFAPDKDPAYGTLYRHSNPVEITAVGLRKSIDVDLDPTLKGYYDDKRFMDGHITKVRDFYEKLVSEAQTPVQPHGFQTIYHSYLSDAFDKGSTR